MNKSNIKALCQQRVQDRLTRVREALEETRAAAHNETKSSAGDKHETARALAQNEVERLGAQLQQWEQVQRVLDGLDTERVHTQVALGSYVVTSQGDFYLSAGLGKIEAPPHRFFAVSLQSPIGQQLKGCVAQDVFTLNGKEVRIEQVY